MLEITHRIIAPGATASARDLLASTHRLAALRQQCLASLQSVDCLVTPTLPRAFTQAEVAADPLDTNSRLGHYTNYMNLLDFAGIAVPAGHTRGGVPFGITLVGDRFTDRRLLAVGALIESWQQATTAPSNAYGAPETVDVAVCGAHLDGLPLNWQLTERDASLVRRTETAPAYRLYALPGGPPFRPGLVRVADGGAAIELEVWRMPAAAFASFADRIPAPLGFGRVMLADGTDVQGFLCESHALDGAVDITSHGGWRAYLATTAA